MKCTEIDAWYSEEKKLVPNIWSTQKLKLMVDVMTEVSTKYMKCIKIGGWCTPKKKKKKLLTDWKWLRKYFALKFVLPDFSCDLLK